MSRRTFLARAAGCAAAYVVPATSLAAAGRASGQVRLRGSRPNIILVLTDDQGMGDLACLGNPLLKTPHLDRFYEKAMRFTDFQASPTCAPSRAAIVSGRHEFKNAVTHTLDEREYMALTTTTFPQLLQRAGYETGIFGKWHLGDTEPYLPHRRGFSESLIHGSGGIGQPWDFQANRPTNKKTGQRRCFDNVLLHNGTIVQTKGFCTDLFFQAALGWMRKQYAAKKPLFAYISTNAPHGPYVAPEKYTRRWLDEGWDGATAGRYGMIENLDDNFGLLMQKLREWGVLGNTLVIFMTDNGQSGKTPVKNGKEQPFYRAGYKWGKGREYEGGTHVPAFWYWKGVLREGVDVPALAAHVDLYPTFCDLAGLMVPGDIQKLDGRTLLPLLEDPKAAWPDRHLFIHRGRWEKGANPNEHKFDGAAVRTQRWRLIWPKNSKDGNKCELYDISNDRFQKKDVAREHPEVVESLKGAYNKWWEEITPLLVNEDRHIAEEFPLHVRYQKQLEEKGIPDWTPPTF